MAFSAKLAELVVDFVGKGADALKGQIGGIKENLVSVAKATPKAALDVAFAPIFPKAFAAILGTVQTTLKQVEQGAQQFAKTAESAFGYAKFALLGFITAGVAGTQAGNLLTTQMRYLSIEIASLFVPELQKVIDLLGKTVDWFRSLSGEQQRSIAHWIEAGLAVLVVAKAMPMLFQGIGMVVGGVKALTLALTGSGIGAILPLIGFLVSAFVALGVGTKVGKDGLEGLWEAVQPVVESVKKFVDIIMTALVPVMDSLYGYFLQAVEIFQTVAQAAIPLLKEAFTRLAQTIMAAFREIEPYLPMLAELFSEVIIGSVIAFADAMTIVVNIFRTCRDWTEQLIIVIGKLAKSLDIVIAKIPGLKKVADFIGLTAVDEGLTKLWHTVEKVRADRDKPTVKKAVTASTKKGPAAARTTLDPSKVGTEAITATLSRLQQASLKQDIGKLQLDVQKQIAADVSTIAGKRPTRGLQLA